MYIFIFIMFALFFNISKANAFLPPEFFVQGLSSVLAVVAGGVAVAIAPFLMFFKFLKTKFKRHKKLIGFLVLQNIIVAVFLGLFFYYKFYKPLYEDSYLFSGSHSVNMLHEGQLDPSSFNNNYIIQNGFYRDMYNDKNNVNEKFVLTIEELEVMTNDKKIYFIDVREIEEYNAGHISGSVHHRGMDLTVEKIKEVFSLDNDKFNEGVFVLVCHDGGRGLLQAEKFNMENIKYIHGGIEALDDYSGDAVELTGPVFADYEIFDKKYQKKYQMTADEAIKKIKNKENILIIDGRHKKFFDKEHIVGSVQLNIGRMTTPEYRQALQKILDNKNAEIIVLCNRYGELFHANLLFLRLERDHGLNDNNFNIVFNQLNEFKKDQEILFENNIK